MKRTGLFAILLVVVIAAGLAAVAQSPNVVKQEKKIIVDLVTTKGTITLELWPDQAPQTVQNFVNYVIEGHYDGTIFHRVIKGFMIQGGGYTKDLKEKQTRPAIPLEAKAPNRKYTIAMARTADPNSATAQFYINLVDNPNLDAATRPPGYAVFGKVIAGTEVVDQIEKVKTGRKGFHDDVPNDDVVIEQAAEVAA